ncbi:hypothetical protein DRJ54_02365 [Candidatus Acetothermia bacterium]|nr:MAG: hypothetical protein DRJ54_02365 [Candidatus Acetothermia bacterium]
MLKRALAVGVLVLAGVGMSMAAPGPGLFRLADAAALAAYPTGEPGTELYVLALPEARLAVIIRPLSREEYGAFQIQAIGHQLIERQMLAAALALPRLGEGEIAALPPEVVELIQRAVNEVSGFTVFPDVALPGEGG